jgi:hypothetical protein
MDAAVTAASAATCFERMATSPDVVRVAGSFGGDPVGLLRPGATLQVGDLQARDWHGRPWHGLTILMLYP